MPTSFTTKVNAQSQRDDARINYYGTREGMYSSRGVQPLLLENGYGFRLENGEYLLGEALWPSFTTEVSTASSRD